MPPATDAIDDDPTLTTTRRAAATAGRAARHARPSIRRSVPRGPGRLPAPASIVGSQSKTQPSSPPMTTSAPAVAPSSTSLASTPEPGQPVGEVADGLVVGEVGLAHPALGALAPHPEAVALARDREALVVDGLGAQHDAGRVRRRRRGARRGHDRGHREGQLAQPLVADRRHLVHGVAALLEDRGDQLGQLPRLGHVDLVEGDQPRAVGEAAVRASSASITSRSLTGSRPGSSVAQSRTWTRTAQRSTWRRNSSPRPLPSLAPGISPGTSATV